MIQKAIRQWDAHKEGLRLYLATHRQRDYNSYDRLFSILVDKVLNAEGADNMHLTTSTLVATEPDSYSGTQYFTVVDNNGIEYQSNSYYGSCTGCDAIEYITDGAEYPGVPTEQQVKLWMLLCLHMVQRLDVGHSNEEVEGDYGGVRELAEKIGFKKYIPKDLGPIGPPKPISEETASLLAYYLNKIREDVAIDKKRLNNLYGKSE